MCSPTSWVRNVVWQLQSSSSYLSAENGSEEIRLPTSLVRDEDSFEILDEATPRSGNSTSSSSPSLVFIIHGFFASADSDWILGMKDAFLRFHNSDVVRVGWDTSPPLYLKVVVVAVVAVVVIVA